MLVDHARYVRAPPFDQETRRTPGELIAVVEPPLRGLPERLVSDLIKGTVEFETKGCLVGRDVDQADEGAPHSHRALAVRYGHMKVLRGDFPTEADAKRAAEAELACVKRGAATFALDLAVGRPDVFPEMP